jgi:hypothetical protein
MNQYLLQNFNNNTLNYDLSRYNWSQLILDIIKAKYSQVTSLETLHQVLTHQEIADATALVQRKFLDAELSCLLDSFAEEYIAPLIGNSKYLIKRQPTLNLVIPNQSQAGRRLPFHQGIFYDNGRGQGTIWMPLTKCYKSNTMWVMDLETSRDLTKQVIEHGWSVDEFEQECVKHSFPVTLVPGQAHLFGQEHIHGNIENTTDITRLAIDWHILIEGEEYHRRYPGAFFRMPGDYVYNSVVDTNKTFVCYLSHNSEFDKSVGKHAQRCTIEHYVKEQNIKHNGYQFENEYLMHLPIFDYLLEQDVDGIVVFSMYSISDKLLKKAIRLKKEIHFANEYMNIKTTQDLDKVLTYKNFAVSKKGKLSFE